MGFLPYEYTKTFLFNHYLLNEKEIPENLVNEIKVLLNLLRSYEEKNSLIVNNTLKSHQKLDKRNKKG